MAIGSAHRSDAAEEMEDSNSDKDQEEPPQKE